MKQRDHNSVSMPARGEAGVALLAVLWVGVVLGMIAFGTAYMVRTDLQETANRIDEDKSYFLARGGLERAIYEIGRAQAMNRQPGARAPLNEYQPGRRWMQFSSVGGETLVEVVPENAKLSINQAPPEQLAALLSAAGESDQSAAAIAEAIVHWRTATQSDVQDQLDGYYAALPKPYAARHMFIGDLEELLGVRGMSKSLFYGTRTATGPLAAERMKSFPDLFQAQEAGQAVNVNFAPALVLASLPGWDRGLAERVVEEREDDTLHGRPYESVDDLVNRVPSAAPAVLLSSITVNSGNTYTLLATGKVHGSPVMKTLRAVVQLNRSYPLGYRVQSWWDDWPWTPLPQSILTESRGTNESAD